MMILDLFQNINAAFNMMLTQCRYNVMSHISPLTHPHWYGDTRRVK